MMLTGGHPGVTYPSVTSSNVSSAASMGERTHGPRARLAAGPAGASSLAQWCHPSKPGLRSR